MWGIQSTLTDTAKESFTNIRTIRNFAREDYMLEQYSSAANERLKVRCLLVWVCVCDLFVLYWVVVSVSALLCV